jgi:CPA2 family monovalent cation:H+ antiporter-2
MQASFIQDLATILVVAGVVTIVFHRFKQPVVLGYILAGFIVGPHTPSILLVHDEHTVEILAELGVVLLMFSLGQHFSLRKLASVGMTAVIASTLEIALMTWLGYEIGRGFGWNAMDSLFLGALLSISSTTIIVKALGEIGATKERFAELIFGILIIEDILGIAMIAILSSVATTGGLAPAEAATVVGELVVFLVVVLVVGLLTVPRLLKYVASYRSNEMLLVTALAICFGISLLAAKLGYSVALGAFLAGAIVAEARESHRVEALVEPVRDMFSAVFFVAIGMLIDPRLLAEHALPIAVITVAVVLGKIATCSLGAFLAGNSRRTSLRVGMGMAQIGEFSFIIAQLGLTLGVTSGFLYPIAVAVSVITTLLTPYLIRASDGAVSLLERASPRKFLDFVDLYERWVAQIAAPSPDPRRRAARAIVLKLVLQIGLDAVLATGLLVGASALGDRPISFIAEWPAWTGGQRTVLWVAAVALAMPILVHAFTKLWALANVLAELGVAGMTTREQMPRVRAVVATVVYLAAATVLVVWLAIVGVAILPPWPVLAALSTLFAVALAFMWRRFSRLYSRAQSSLRETLSQPPLAAAEHPRLTTLLQDASMLMVPIVPGAPAAGRLIRELQLRTSTGASVVGIERKGVNIVNPGPDDDIAVGDQVLLLGREEHLAQARRALTGA